MDTFVDSAWYYMRYASAGAPTMVDARNDYWMPMDVYIGGIEHAVLHLLYARFWTKVMRDMGLLHFDEPFVRMINHGMLLNHIYFTRNAKGGKDFVPPHRGEAHARRGQGHITGGTRTADGSPWSQYDGVGKMGKTERNGVDPQAADRPVRRRHRAPVRDVRRRPRGRLGLERHRRRRLFALPAPRLAVRVAKNQAATLRSDSGSRRSQRLRRRDQDVALRELHCCYSSRCAYDYERMQYNTVVSGRDEDPECVGGVSARRLGRCWTRRCCEKGFSILLRVLYPACPHMTQVLWSELKFADNLLDAPMPEVDEAALVRDEIELVLQVNGKTRGKVVVPASAGDDAVGAAAMASPEFHKFSEGKTVKLVKVVKGRLVNVVVA